MIKNNFKLKNIVALTGLTYFVLIDYKYFGIFFIFFFIIFGFELKIDKKYEIFYQIAPIVFYIKKVLSGLFDSLSIYWLKTGNNDFYLQAQFPDIKIDLNQYLCQFLLGRYSNYYFENISTCPMGNYRYGPLHHLIRLNVNVFQGTAIWIFSLSIFLCYFYIKVTNKNRDYIPYFAIIFLSPVANFAFHQFNMDLFLNLSAFYFITNIKNKRYVNLNIFMVLLISLIKQHPVAILIGLVFYFLHFKNYRKMNFVIMSIITFLVFNLLYFEKLNLLSGQPRPSGAHNATGFLSFSQYFWVQVMNSYGGYRYVLLIFTFILTLAFSIAWFIRNSRKITFNKYGVDNVTLQYPYIIWFLFVGLYANYDYRNLILILLSLFILKNADTFTIMTYLLLLLSSFFPSYLPSEIINLLFVLKFSSYIYIYAYLLNIGFIPIFNKLNLIKNRKSY